MSGNEVGATAGRPAGRLRVWFERCMLLLFLATGVWALVATYRFHAPFDGFSILFLTLIAGLVCRRTRLLAFPAVLVLFMAISMPMREAVRAPVRSGVCRSHMKRIVLALRHYHDDYGCFPPAYVADEDGRPMHSWRVLILPYLEAEDLYQQYRFDEPWDGPNNSRLAGIDGSLYRCFQYHAGRLPGRTNFLLVTGKGTAWADGRAPRLDEFTDGPESTIILVETATSDIAWSEPRDLTLEEAQRGINLGPEIGISSWHPAVGHSEGQGSANVAFADGSVVSLENDFPLDELKKRLTHQGGETVAPSKLGSN